MDIIKIVLTLCFAAFLALFSSLFALGLLEAISGRPAVGPNPAVARTMQWLCGLPAIGFAVGSFWAVRSAWRQFSSPDTQRTPPAQISAREVVKVALDRQKIAEFNLSRLTGAGLLLGFASIGIPAAIFGYVAFQFGLVQQKPGKIVGVILIVGVVVTFSSGFWILNKLGINVVTPLKSNDHDDDNDIDILEPWDD